MSMTNPFADLAGGDLSEFSPKPKAVPREGAGKEKPSPARLRSVGQEEGFLIDNNPVKRKVLRGGRKVTTEPAVGMSVRFRVSDWNKFAEFCRRNDYTVAEGFGRLVETLDEL